MCHHMVPSDRQLVAGSWIPASLSTLPHRWVALRVCPYLPALTAAFYSSHRAQPPCPWRPTRRSAKAPGTNSLGMRPARHCCLVPLGPFRTASTEVKAPRELFACPSVRTSLEDSSSWSASLPTSLSEPDLTARWTVTRSRHLHVLRNGHRPRGFSPPRRFCSRRARASCSAAGRDSLRFPLFATHLKHLAVPPELRASLPPPRSPASASGPNGPRNAHTPRRIHPSNSGTLGARVSRTSLLVRLPLARAHPSDESFGSHPLLPP